MDVKHTCYNALVEALSTLGLEENIPGMWDVQHGVLRLPELSYYPPSDAKICCKKYYSLS